MVIKMQATPQRTTAGQPPNQTYAWIMALTSVASASPGWSPGPSTQPRLPDPVDFVVLSAAAFKAARTLTRDEVASFLREPFVKGVAHEGDEEPVESGC
jgi:hypothetical protein